MGLNPFSGNDYDCKGHYGTVEDKGGGKTKGIKMQCDGFDQPLVVRGEREEAEAAADSWLSERGMSASIQEP